MIYAQRDDVVVIEGSRTALGSAFQTINALYQEVGDRFAVETGHEWEDGQQLLHAANLVLSGSG